MDLACLDAAALQCHVSKVLSLQGPSLQGPEAQQWAAAQELRTRHRWPNGLTSYKTPSMFLVN